MLKLTTEQQDVIDAVREHNRILVNALAGTGKTTTLIEIAKAYKEKKILILSFNRLVANEIQNRINWQEFLNTEVYTFHALASRELGVRSRKDSLREFVYHKEKEFSEAVYIALKRFCESDLSIDDLTPEKLRELVYYRKEDSLTIIVEEEQQKDADEFYSKLTDKVRKIYKEALETCLDDYDLYLKYFAETGSLENYDIVLVDEAQDLNPVQHKICSKAKKIVYIGDKHQTIYSWRGAVDLDEVERDIELYLTIAFRFSSPDIIDKANAVLNILKSRKKIQQATQPKPPNEEKAVITRTNVRLVEEARRLGSVRFKKKIDDLLQPFKLAQAFLDLYFRSSTNLLVPPWLKKLVENLKEHNRSNFVEALSSYDLSLKTAVKFMLDNRLTIRDIRKILKTARTRDKKAPLLATAHSVKGLEYGEVRLTNDFYTLNDLKDRFKIENIENLTENRKAREELNLVYVATTRAMKNLEVPLSLENLYKYGKTYSPLEEKKEETIIEQKKNYRETQVVLLNQANPTSHHPEQKKSTEEATKTISRPNEDLEIELEKEKIVRDIVDEHYEKFCSEYATFKEDCLKVESFFEKAEARIENIENSLNRLIQTEIASPDTVKDSRYINGLLLCLARILKKNASKFSDSYLWYKIDTLMDWLVKTDLYSKIGFLRRFYNYKKGKWTRTSEITLLEGIWCISANTLPKAYIFVYVSKYLPQLKEIAKSKYSNVTRLVCKECSFYLPESFSVKPHSFTKEEAESILQFLETFLERKRI